jgi:metal-responsive CopG/Arc/MetJ family transcriptional regulator
MPVRTTVDIPEPLHNRLRQRAESSGASIRSLIVRAIEETYAEPKKGERVTGPMISATGKRGPRYPVDENPYDLIFP